MTKLDQLWRVVVLTGPLIAMYGLLFFWSALPISLIAFLTLLITVRYVIYPLVKEIVNTTNTLKNDIDSLLGQENPQQRTKYNLRQASLKGLTSSLKVRVLGLRNIFLTPDEREEWLGDLKEAQYRMRYIEKRSRWAIWAYTIDQHRRFCWSKLTILVSNLVSKIS